MVESRTARMRLVQWSSGTDSPQRVDFNETFLNIETLAAIDQQGAINDRPAPSKTGAYYFATDQAILYRSDGLAWAVVGASVLSQLVRPARTDLVAQTLQGLPSQVADLFRALSSGNTVYQRIRSNGDLIHGPLRVSQLARTASGTETVPTDSAATLDNNSTGMWGLSLLNTTGNTAGFLRAVRGGSVVFSISSTGAFTGPSATLTSAPSSDNHAVRRVDLTTAVANATYNLDSSNLPGVLPIIKGGTGRTVATAGAYLRGNQAGDAYEGVSPANLRNDIKASPDDHTHTFSEIRERLIAAQLPVSTELPANADLNTIIEDDDYTQSSSAEAESGTNYPAGVAGWLRVVSTSSKGMVWQVYTVYNPSNPTMYVRARYNGTWGPWRQMADVNDIAALVNTYAAKVHGHSLTDSNITGTLPVSQGGTGSTTAAAARDALGAANAGSSIVAGAGLSGGGTLITSRTLQVVFEGNGSKSTVARSDHGHALTDANITGVLPVSQGGTGGTTATSARSGIQAAHENRQIRAGVGLSGGGNLLADRTLDVVFPGLDFTHDGGASTGSANIAARYDHQHNLAGNLLTGNLPWTKAPIPITLTTEDLDTITATATYHQGSNANATTARNYPIGMAGRLDVTTVGLMTYQTYTDYSHTGSIWKRQKYSSNAWYGWQRMVEQRDLDAMQADRDTRHVLTLPSNREYAGHGYAPCIIREGKKRTMMGRVAATGSSYFAASVSGTIDVFTIPTIDRPAATVGHIGQITGIATPGYSRLELSVFGNLTVSVSKDTSWLGLDGMTWFVS